MSEINEKNDYSLDSQSPTRLDKTSNVVETGPPPFRWRSLIEDPVINPLNGKSYTLPLLNLRSPHARNFHLAWLGFFVAFLSWFAFPPLIPEAIKEDLHLTTAEVGNSNIVALSATLIMRLVAGPVVDRYGPRVSMAGLLILGAIPSGLAGVATNIQSLMILRFFIGILGATFVPCLVWTTCFFDKSVVGTANGFVGGWGNLGGGVTFIVMTSLYEGLRNSGLSQAIAWRASFAIIPVPILLGTAALTLVFGTDHPAGKWSARHTLPATLEAVKAGHAVQLDRGEQHLVTAKKQDSEKNSSTVVMEVEEDSETDVHGDRIPVGRSVVDIAVNEALTWKLLGKILINPLTWLPALAYATTFGFELAVDSNLPNVFLNPHPYLGQMGAGYLAAIFGLLNLYTRPLGGYLSDVLYKRYGIKSKVWFTLGLGIGQGIVCIAFGLYLQLSALPSVGVMVLFVVIIAHFNELANGANFSLVPHCNAYSNGTMSGITGACGNLGGLVFATIWRFNPAKGVAWWICGIVALVVNVVLLVVRHPKS